MAKNLLKDHMVEAGHTHCHVLDPTMDMNNNGKAEIWGDDPTMPRPAIFDSYGGRHPVFTGENRSHTEEKG
jgi:hypothetical protein